MAERTANAALDSAIWSVHVDGKGRKFYHNNITKTSHWTIPVKNEVEAKAASDSAADGNAQLERGKVVSINAVSSLARAADGDPTRAKRTKIADDIRYEDFSIFEGIKCPDPKILGFNPRKKWDNLESNQWFKFVRTAVSEDDLKGRLTLLAFYHRSHIDYAKGNLYETREWWADCFLVWEFTGGMLYSNFAEHWFRSILHYIEKQTVPIVGLVRFMRQVVEKRETETYASRDAKLVTKVLPALINDLETTGWANVVLALKDFIGEANPATLNLHLSVILSSTEYSASQPADALSKRMFDLAGYQRPSAAVVVFLSLLTGKVGLDRELRNNPLFRDHVEPAEKRGALFLIQRCDGKGNAHLVLYYEGGIVCDCDEFHHFGCWCKHIYCLVRECQIDFVASHALDQMYMATESERKQVAIGIVHARDRPMTMTIPKRDRSPITKPWHWARDEAEEFIRSQRGRMCNDSTSSANDQREGQLKSLKAESERRRERLRNAMNLANSNRELAKLTDDYLDAFEKTANIRAASSKTNADRTDNLNPMPLNRNVMEIAINKTPKY